MNDHNCDIAQEMRTMFTSVSEFVHTLAHQLDSEQLDLDPSRLNAISCELKRIGWNTLFVGSTIDILVRASPPCDNPAYLEGQTAFLRQVDGLHIAVKYLAQSVRSLRTEQAAIFYPNSSINEVLDQLADKLLEVAGECRHP